MAFEGYILVACMDGWGLVTTNLKLLEAVVVLEIPQKPRLTFI